MAYSKDLHNLVMAAGDLHEAATKAYGIRMHAKGSELSLKYECREIIKTMYETRQAFTAWDKEFDDV